MNQKDISLKKLPPNNIFAEKSVLGAILLDSDSIIKALQIIDETDFYSQINAKIFKVMKGMSWRGEAIDLVTLSEGLLQSGDLEMIGGPPYLMDLMEVTPTAETITNHARIIKNKSMLRRIIALSTQMNLEAYGEKVEVESLLKQAEENFYEIRESLNENNKEFRPLKEAVFDLYSKLEALEDPDLKKEAVRNIIPTGYLDLDELIVGVPESDMVIVAGRPSMGKTSFLFGLTGNFAKQGYPVGIFSIETNEERCAERFLCTESEVDSHNIRRGVIGSDEWKRLVVGQASLEDLPIHLYDCPGLTLQDFRFRVKNIVKKHGVKLVVLDHLGLMSVEGLRGRSRVEEVSKISSGIKSVLREFKVRGIIVSQLSRKVEDRKPPRPILSDLRESGTIEQDADMVIMLYRHGYYEKKMDEFGGEDLVTEIIVNKNRNGRIGTVKLVFRKRFTRFENISQKGGY
jgi:replicative DNA helicase